MSYVVPSVLVYQQLASAGVANVTPDLDELILGPCYNVVYYTTDTAATLAASAATDVAGSVLSITDNTINLDAYLPSTKAGQIVDPSSLAVYLNNAAVQTVYTQFTGSVDSNVLTFAPASLTGAMSANASVITGVTNASVLVKGDKVTITGAGLAGTDLVTAVVSTTSTTVTVADAASTAVTGAAVTKSGVSNTNSATSTLRVEAGDTVVIKYNVSSVFTTTILSVTTTSGNLSVINLTDVLPTGMPSQFTLSVRKSYNNLLLAGTYNSHLNYDASAVSTTGKIVLKPEPAVSYGTVVTADVHIAYRALRTDLSEIQEITQTDDITGNLGTITDDNPLALAASLALANTTTRVMCLAVATNDLAGYTGALEKIENIRVYSIVPLTQDTSITTAVQAHVEGMSTAENAAWRMALINTAPPTTQAIGQYNSDSVNANSGNNTITIQSGNYVLTSSNSTFVTDGVVAGDSVVITAATGSPSQVATVKVLGIISNQQMIIAATGTATAVSFYISRTLTRTQQAAWVVAQSTAFGSKRVVHVQPDSVGVTVNGVVKYLPGYYLCAALGALIAGLPAQKGLTNIGIAGISDLKHSNFYYTRAQLNSMAAAGTLLFVQEAKGTIPYIRHELTTDMTVLQYREIQQVKNIDFLSYYFHDILKGFIGKWNITPDSLNTLRQTITAGGNQLKLKKVAMIGAPLIDFSITKLEQDADNADNVNAVVPVKIPTVMNYINLYLVS